MLGWQKDSNPKQPGLSKRSIFRTTSKQNYTPQNGFSHGHRVAKGKNAASVGLGNTPLFLPG